MARSLVPAALLLGNFAVGTSILAPAGMLPALSEAFSVTIREASLLITLGAVVLGVGTPLVSGWTSRMDRRLLLASSLGIIAVAQVASALTDSFGVLLATRLVMLTAAAPFTPQAAGVVGALVPVERRAGTIAFVFLGWSLAAALGMPLVSTLSGRLGIDVTYAVLAGLALLAFVLVAAHLPRGLRTEPVDLEAWADLVRDPSVLLLLLITVLLTAGQFMTFTFLGPLLVRLAQASADAVGVVFALFGLMGLIGNVTASRIVGRIGPYRTSVAAVLAMVSGAVLWAVGAGSLVVMALGMAIWGLGFASSNSMQQARLVATAPSYAGASVALNSSSLYLGQAVGSALGGALFEHTLDRAIGFGTVGLLLLALGALALTRPRARTASVARTEALSSENA